MSYNFIVCIVYVRILEVFVSLISTIYYNMMKHSGDVLHNVFIQKHTAELGRSVECYKGIKVYNEHQSIREMDWRGHHGS